MRSLDVFFLFIFLSLSTHSLQAQLSRFSRIYSGGGSMSADNSDIRLSATPATQYFLGRKVSFGGQMQINGSFNRGLQLVVAEPELRFYFNPDHFRTQWFAFSRGHFGVYTKESEQLDIPFILSGGLGILAHLGDGLVWESTFYVSFHQEPVSSFFEYPAFFL
ncbi:MAG: hypothetical protein KDD15_01100, partial [Lewinella sp.]|nr:hypothetical protein [Lewinella sp.]